MKNKRLIRVMSTFWNMPADKVERYVSWYKNTKKEWKCDWEGELSRFRKVAAMAYRERHRKQFYQCGC